MENSIKLYVYVTSAFSVSVVADGLSDEFIGDIILTKDAIKDLTNAQIARMIKSLDDEASFTHKDSKDVLVPALFKELDGLEVDHVAPKAAARKSSGSSRRSTVGSTKDSCYTVFAEYNLADKEESKVALVEAMKACEMAEDDVKGKRVVQSYMSYYRKDVKNGDITDSKTVYEAAE